MSKNNSFNVWPSFTDVIIGIFLIFMVIAITFIIKNYIDNLRLKHLEEIVGKVENEISIFKEFFSTEKVEVLNNEIKIIIDEESQVVFSSNESNPYMINQLGQQRLKSIGSTLKKFLDVVEDKNIFSILIEGYTDRVASDEFNYSLSYQRAKNIMLFWEKECGLDPSIYDISPVGYGELISRLKVFTEDQKAEAQNRRIEIRLVPKFGELFKSFKLFEG